MQEEERNVGAVTCEVYRGYLAAGRGCIMVPVLLLSFMPLQDARVMSSYWLVYWQERKFNQPSGFYVRRFGPLFLETYFFRWAFMLAWESR